MSIEANPGLAWTERETIERLVRLLHAYEGQAPDTVDQRLAYLALREAFPNLDFNPRLDPRSIVIRRLAELFLAAADDFAQAIASLVRSRSLGLEELCTMVSALADARAVISPATAYELAQHLARMPQTPLADDGFAALPQVLGQQPGAILSLLERMTEQSVVRPETVYAGLQAIASCAPAHLGAALAIQSSAIESSAVDALQLSTILRDVANRCGPYTLLLAIAEQEPVKASTLISAAFGEADSLFQLVSTAVRNEEDQVLRVTAKAKLMFLSDERLGRPVQPWLADVRKVLRKRTALAVYENISSGAVDRQWAWAGFSSMGLRAQGVPTVLVEPIQDDMSRETVVLVDRAEFFFAAQQG